MKIQSKTLVLPVANIDTDQIIPARFLTTTSREGLGKFAFADWRYDDEGKSKDDCILNDPRAKECQALVGGHNFGCGSSREHAPWALLDFGFRAVISSEIADIFRSNSQKNGLLPVLVDPDTHAWLLANPWSEVSIDLQSQTLSLADGKTVNFPMDGFAKHCLLQGLDQLGYLLSQEAAISQFESTH